MLCRFRTPRIPNTMLHIANNLRDKFTKITRDTFCNIGGGQIKSLFEGDGSGHQAYRQMHRRCRMMVALSEGVSTLAYCVYGLCLIVIVNG
jgi:hypothetical protein